ncbi:MAG TPA: hypothetical protein VEO54_04760 [Thermoanaerobaculia bacterium]|nr:hypothetical protein [Thermoanaerobaculia bacterium]
MKRMILLFSLALILPLPLHAAPDEQVALRSVANIARMAIGSSCVDPDTSSVWTFGPPPATYFDGGTPNQKMLVRVWHYGWALRARPADLGTIRATLLDFINRQQQVTGSGGPLGHYATTAGANEELIVREADHELVRAAGPGGQRGAAPRPASGGLQRQSEAL